jgi:hypothetical protein
VGHQYAAPSAGLGNAPKGAGPAHSGLSHSYSDLVGWRRASTPGLRYMTARQSLGPALFVSLHRAIALADDGQFIEGADKLIAGQNVLVQETHLTVADPSPNLGRRLSSSWSRPTPLGFTVSLWRSVRKARGNLSRG